jgi:hypothetical protein
MEENELILKFFALAFAVVACVEGHPFFAFVLLVCVF